jgi:hypothetical protein
VPQGCGRLWEVEGIGNSGACWALLTDDVSVLLACESFGGVASAAETEPGIRTVLAIKTTTTKMQCTEMKLGNRVTVLPPQVKTF